MFSPAGGLVLVPVQLQLHGQDGRIGQDEKPAAETVYGRHNRKSPKESCHPVHTAILSSFGRSLFVSLTPARKPRMVSSSIGWQIMFPLASST